MTTRDKVLDMARIAKKQLRGKTRDQAARWCRGYWLVAVGQDQSIKKYRDEFMVAALGEQ